MATGHIVRFTVDYTTEEGRAQAARLAAWLAKERYDCPDDKVAGMFHGIMRDIEDELFEFED